MKYLTSAIPLLLLSRLSPTLCASSYLENSKTAVQVLNEKWYDNNTGIWGGDLWWNSANMITTIANLALLDDTYKAAALDVISNTYAKAPSNHDGVTSPTWLNNFYDDEGWWALALIASYDLTNNGDYLNQAVGIFNDMMTGWGTPCGGIWWSKDRENVNTIANNLMLSVAAHLANRMPASKDASLSWFNATWQWYEKTPVIAANQTVYDGLNIDNCQPDSVPFFTYNAGVLIGALVEMNKATGDAAWIDKAHDIAGGALAQFEDGNDVLQEWGGVAEDDNLAQFKGIFMRNLMALEKVSHKDAYVTLMTKSADSLWANDNNGNLLGPHWEGPYVDASPPSHSSAIDCLIAAAAVS